jgi:hypothetical protein
VSIRQWALAPLALLLTVGVHAQTAAPAKSDAKADPKAEAAAAAMERAKRMAAGPMRVILEASKGKRVPAEAVAAPAADSNSVRTVATRAAVVPEAAARAAPAAQVNAAETVPAPAAAAPAPAPTANAVTTQITLNSESLQGQSVANVPSLERAASAAAAVMPNLPAASMVLPKVADALVKPKLINRVDPELSQRLLDDLGRNAVVSVDLSLRADGSVAGVVFVTSVSTRVQRAVAAALEQWRFEPLASDRVHRVELIFNGE